MNKFDNNAIYFGTLIIIENQHEKIYKEKGSQWQCNPV